MTVLEFFAPGLPRPAGSKKAFPIWRGPQGQRVFTGRVAVVDDAGKPGKDWRAVVQLAARTAVDSAIESGAWRFGFPVDVPLRLALTFFFPRPKGHFGKHGVLPSAPAVPATRPDLTKCTRSVEDALTGVVWRDDAQIVEQTVRKFYDNGEGIGVAVSIACLEATALAPQRALGLRAAAEA
jgi:Holliday junction resolvase RusA-like endonuclease